VFAGLEVGVGQARCSSGCVANAVCEAQVVNRMGSAMRHGDDVVEGWCEWSEPRICFNGLEADLACALIPLLDLFSLAGIARDVSGLAPRVEWLGALRPERKGLAAFDADGSGEGGAGSAVRVGPVFVVVGAVGFNALVAPASAVVRGGGPMLGSTALVVCDLPGRE
jgi:hypothetical protein